MSVWWQKLEELAKAGDFDKWYEEAAVCAHSGQWDDKAMARAAWDGGQVALPSELASRDAECERLRAMLRRLEWRDKGDIEKQCPVCYGWGKHDKGCELAALLRQE